MTMKSTTIDARFLGQHFNASLSDGARAPAIPSVHRSVHMIAIVDVATCSPKQCALRLCIAMTWPRGGCDHTKKIKFSGHVGSADSG